MSSKYDHKCPYKRGRGKFHPPVPGCTRACAHTHTQGKGRNLSEGTTNQEEMLAVTRNSESRSKGSPRAAGGSVALLTP